MKPWRLPPFLSLFLVGVLIFGGTRLYYFLTDDFYLGNISDPIPAQEAWRVSSTLADHEIKTLLSQPYHYVGKGAQCYAFASDDGEYILKFFKFKHLRPHRLWAFLPSWGPLEQWKRKEAEQKEQRMQRTFSGYKLAYEQFSDLSQIVHLHLNPGENDWGAIHVIDKMGREWEVPSSTTPFLIQKRGQILRSVLSDHLRHERMELAKEALEKIFFMYLKEYRSGTYDRDHGIMHNTGFVGETPFHLDVGKFCICESMSDPAVFAPDLRFVIWKMDIWLKEHFPKQTPELIGHLADLYQKETGQQLELKNLDPNQFKRKKKR